ncbi:MAG: serine--tRNA ligase, partial [Thermodesulfobacteriota bacterium]
MLELRFIRENSDLVREKILRRGMAPDLIDRFVEIDGRRLALLAEAENLKNRRNTVSREIAELKQRGDSAQADPLILEMREVSARIKELDGELAVVQEQLQDIVMSIPNLCDDTVPVGKDDSDNVEVKTWGEKPSFSFTPLAHWEIGEQLGILDFETAAKLAGARFALLKGFGA